MPIHNSDLERILNNVADLLDIYGANQYRIRAYRNAAQIISGFSQSFANMIERGEDLTQIEGIGKDMAQKIQEIASTGTLSLLEELKEHVPAELLQLLGIAGLGPKKVRALYKQLGIKSLKDLQEAAEQEKIRKLQGFGQKTEENIFKELKEMQKKKAQRFRISTIDEIAYSLISYMKKAKGIEHIDIAGSYRRRKETVKDIDILVIAENAPQVMDHFLSFEDIDEVIMHGNTRSSARLRLGVQVDVRVVPEECYGAALHYFTGSKAHNIATRQLGLQKNLKINEYGVFQHEKRIAGKTEKEVYSSLGLDFIEPELREDRGEIEAAQEHRLPKLITSQDLRGDLHVHSNYTDGKNSLEEIALEAKAWGYEYLAITDHSQRLKMARGLDEKRLAQQIEEINKVNEKINGIVLLKGIEVDILEDGNLDLADNILKELDLTIVAVHSKFNLSRDKQTNRIIKAMNHPCVNILAHPTGRMINVRAAYDVDIDKIIETSAEIGCFLEINSQPDRLDLNEIYAKRAKEIGAKCVISTDAHHLNGLKCIHFGVNQARRGWLEKTNVLNSLDLNELKKALQR